MPPGWLIGLERDVKGGIGNRSTTTDPLSFGFAVGPATIGAKKNPRMARGANPGTPEESRERRRSVVRLP